jgi:hypothetical protein
VDSSLRLRDLFTWEAIRASPPLLGAEAQQCSGGESLDNSVRWLRVTLPGGLLRLRGVATSSHIFSTSSGKHVPRSIATVSFTEAEQSD